MAKKCKERDLQNLPACAAEYIKLVIKKMRYCKKVRLDVQAELAAHFEDELRDCTTDEEKEQKAQRLIEQFGDAKLLGTLLRRAKKRCRPFWRTVFARTFQTVGALILCFTAYMVWFLTGKPAITVDYIAEVNRLTRPATDENLNAAPLFEQAAAVCPNIPLEEGNFWRSYFDANEAEHRVIEGWVQLCADSLNLIAQGAEKPYFWRQLKTSGDPNDDGSMLDVVLMPSIPEIRKLAFALCSRAQIQAARGEYSSAFDDLIVCYKFGRLIGQGERSLTEQLYGFGIQAAATKKIREILSHYPVPVEQLAVLQADFAKAQAGQEFRIRLLNEKLMVYDEIQRCFTEDRLGGGHLYLKRLPIIVTLVAGKYYRSEILPEALLVRTMFFHPNKAETRHKANEVYDFFEETSKMSPAQLREKGIDWGKQVESITKGNIFLRIWMPAVGAELQRSYYSKTDIQSVPVIIAALRFKIDKGQYPEDLAELQRLGYIKEIPIDPFSDQPLVYKKTADNFTLYSVGPNFKDDGGQVYRNEKGKPQLWNYKFGDAVFWPVQK